MELFFLFQLSVLRFFLEYQWLVDFAVYTTGIFLFTECYYCVVDARKEVNIGAIWCVLTVLFCLYPSCEESLCGVRDSNHSQCVSPATASFHLTPLPSERPSTL